MILAVLIFLAATTAAVADVDIVGDAPIATGKAGSGHAITVAGKTALVLKTSNGRAGPARRAELAASRLRALQGRRLPVSGFVARRTGFSYWVCYGDTRIVAATSAEAREHGTSRMGLAQSWCASLRLLLALPPLAADPKDLLVPMGESREIRLVGYAVGKVAVEPAGANAGSVIIDQPAKPGLQRPPIKAQNSTAADTGAAQSTPAEGSVAPPAAEGEQPASGIVVTPASDRRLVVSGRVVGDYQIVVRSGEHRIGAPISVRKWAGRLAEIQAAEVTGSPAGIRAIQQSVWNALRRSVEVEPGAQLALDGAIAGPQAFASGTKARATARVEIAGGNYITRKATVDVPIRHRAIEQPAPLRLLYSNDPERFKRLGTLYYGVVEPDTPARLFIHHQNGVSASARVSLYLINQTSEPAEAHVLNGLASGVSDIIGVARDACEEYLLSRRAVSGAVISVSPHDAERFASFLLPHNATCTGIFDISPLSGAGLEVAVVAEVPHVAAGSALAYYESQKPDSPTFSATVRRVSASYTIGKPWAFITLGRSETKEARTGNLLYGDYGVLYEIECTIENPLPESKKVEVRLDPSAGLAAGSFIIDGRLVKAPRVAPPREAVLSTFVVGPGQSRKITILTMPLAGAHYPARLVIGSR